MCTAYHHDRALLRQKKFLHRSTFNVPHLRELWPLPAGGGGEKSVPSPPGAELGVSVFRRKAAASAMEVSFTRAIRYLAVVWNYYFVVEGGE